jgi:ATP-binding cassette, subfamily B, bacterial HlyB/CyaB
MDIGIPNSSSPATTPDSGLASLAAVAAFFRISCDPADLSRELALATSATRDDILRAAKRVGLKAKSVNEKRFSAGKVLPTPCIAALSDGSFAVFAGKTDENSYRLVDPVSFTSRSIDLDEFLSLTKGNFILLQRGFSDTSAFQRRFGFVWFLPSLWRYRSALVHVFIASLFLQFFALITPLFFQVVVDKVLAHRSYSTLTVLIVGLAAIGLFDVVLQYLRTYALTHTTNRIDVELGRRLVRHLLSLPLNYFETRAAGQTVARVRELETIRDFLTGQALFSVLDLVFTVVFIAVLFAYSSLLAWIVVASIPFFVFIGFIIRPSLKHRIDEKFDRGALSQQLLVESVIGMQTLKAAAIEPVVAAQWEERFAAYVQSSFAATMLATKGQTAIQYVNKITSAALLLFGAQAVIDNELTVGGLVAFNMIAGQVFQPVLRLSQLWQDFQQVQVSVERLSDVLNAAAEPKPEMPVSLPVPQGAISFKAVNFRYASDGPDILKNISLSFRSGEVIGIVGPSGSGKSTLTKLLQRFYLPSSGQIMVDGQDIAHVNPAWLRSNIGVVLQENMLFNRTIHENISIANPAMSRAAVINLARLSGADEFVAKLPKGYDTVIEERGANLSGGQRQRLAIARALSVNPPILILDEATSALDYESERLVLANMRHIVQGRTVLIIAHRLATIRMCDRIIGMADGRIVEEGSHDDLLAREGGLYRHLWELQIGSSR